MATIQNKKPTIEEALSEFYKLKSKYENDYNDKYIIPIVKNVKKNARQKRIDFSKLPLRPCINCGRNVGSIFSIKTHEDLKRTFSVKCGDAKEPCSLNILFHYSNRTLYEDTINELLASMEQLKTDIIKEKNNALFFVKDIGKNERGNEKIDRFEEITAELKRTAGLVGSLIEQNILQTDNPVRIEETRKLIYNFNTNYVRPFKTMIERYSQYDSDADITESLRFYTEEMTKILEEIRGLKYHINDVEYDENTRIYTLFQKKNTLEDMEYFYEGDDDVVHFVRGNALYGNAVKQRKKRQQIEEQNKDVIEEEEEENVEEQNKDVIEEEEENVEEEMKKSNFKVNSKTGKKRDQLKPQNKTTKVRRIDRRIQLAEDSQESPLI